MKFWLDSFVQQLHMPVLDSALDVRIYRNNIRVAEREALRANYPSVHQLLGDEVFDHLGLSYLQAHPNDQPSLLDLGHSFAAWLYRFQAGSGHELPPYLPAIAELDRAWTVVHCAADACAIEISEIEALVAQNACVKVHPAAYTFFSKNMPAAQIFLQSRAGVKDFSSLHWQGGGVLITRPTQHVQMIECSEVAYRLFMQLHAACPLTEVFEALDDAQAVGQALFVLVAHGALIKA